jgi:hypothetical protein
LRKAVRERGSAGERIENGAIEGAGVFGFDVAGAGDLEMCVVVIAHEHERDGVGRGGSAVLDREHEGAARATQIPVGVPMRGDHRNYAAPDRLVRR